ncbi:deacetylase [Pseudoalteromonas ruthenica]|uniref:Deacetylase n=2 Tax=Pseudoalteromonas ruthenica TaxID=151081 RepID=A0A5S3Z4F2_9GAMM|nr:histone deacetylase family protein [Pseudoalteromonas ruthenica]TMP86416.1 deacetylase [Pseudoalteromonas ruthenica]
MSRIAVITHPACRRHEMGSEHPESPERLDVISDRLLASSLDLEVRQLQARGAQRQDYLRVHSERLVHEVEQRIPDIGYADLDGDTRLCPQTLHAIERAVGAGLTAVDEILAGHIDAGFCAVRPPGHHASEDRSAGFCIFNNLAIAVRYAQSLGIERIAVLDIDVHHGDGTQSIFSDDDSVLLCSLFQRPLYPDPELIVRDNLVQSPLPPASDGQALREVVAQQWLPRLQEFKPQLIFVSAGFDAHLEDDMSALKFVEQDYGWFSQCISEFAQSHDVKGVVSFLEGGYHLSALSRSVEHYLRGQLG